MKRGGVRRARPEAIRQERPLQMEQRAVQALRNDPQMRTAFINRVAAIEVYAAYLAYTDDGSCIYRWRMDAMDLSSTVCLA